ncbi:DSD1 family PLP-dependent enzyme [Rubrivivax rivuli]|uniref:DSD1 family PLP-dependent enzyme n=1 Tax=Rubrivivax rivuli TaxID=1862385 RepID=A0A437RAW4_9BURK|nr:DSD1 family PLP-dependent enzyme [Rubrivivax rivuli]RVU43883.1 DSD1 family PLP-dependent enzyme [Rubrivivax rivuli]
MTSVAGRRAPARVGDPVAAIDTPALVIDLDAMERNLAAMAAFAHAQGLRLRPHAKTHKSAAIAQLQRAAGAVGVCVQKLSEAEALAEQGVPDLYISNEIVDPAKLARVAVLAGRVRLAIAVDSHLGIDRLAAALKAEGTEVDVFVEIDVGQGRCGVAPADAGALALRVVSHGLRWAGLQAYHGGAQHLRSAAERKAAIEHAAGAVRAAKASLALAGLACPLVTGAGTGTFALEAASGLWGELQCGSYVFMDRDYADNHLGPEPLGAAPVAFEHALFVKSQVISVGAAHAVVDAGHKSHAIDSGMPKVWQGGFEFRNGGDEHGILTPVLHTEPGAAALPSLGDTVWLIPGHCDPTVNLHGSYVGVRGGLAQGVVETVWPVDARGCLT